MVDQWIESPDFSDFFCLANRLVVFKRIINGRQLFLEILMKFDNDKSSVLVLCLVLFLCLCSCGKYKGKIQWDTYHSKDNLFEIKYPHDWKISLDGHTFNITPPDDTGLVAVTGYVDPGPVFDEKAFKWMVMRDFVECRVKEPFAPSVRYKPEGEKGTSATETPLKWQGETEPFVFVHEFQWIGEDALYERTVNEQKLIYLFRVAHLGQVGVFVAASELDVHMKARMPIYKQIMDSLVILNVGLSAGVSVAGPAKVKQLPWQENVIKWIEEQIVGWIRSTEPDKDNIEGDSNAKTAGKSSPEKKKDQRSYFGL